MSHIPKAIRKTRFRIPVEEKFIRLAEPSLGLSRCRAFIDWAWRLEEADDIGEMFPLLAIS